MFSFENFVTLQFVLSFAGMVLTVILLTQITKSFFDGVFPSNKTKFVVLGWSVLLCAFAGAWTGKFVSAREIIETCTIWTINSVVVWFTAMKAFEQGAEKIAKKMGG